VSEVTELLKPRSKFISKNQIFFNSSYKLGFTV